MVTLGKAHKLEYVANFLGAIRIISRYPRTQSLFEDLPKAYQKVREEQSLGIFIQGILGVIGDFLNLLYFFFDHYMGLFLLGVFTDEHHLAFADFWGNYIWTCSSFFYFLRNIFMIYHYFAPRKT